MDNYRPVTTLRFDGPRFVAHGLDIDVLPELIAYKQLLVETAKHLWHMANPERERIPRGFEESLSLSFFRLDEGSTAVPIMRQITPGQIALERDEFDQAADLIESGIDAAGSQQPLPEHLSKTILPFFGGLGKTLRADESIFMQTPYRTQPVHFNKTVRDRITSYVEGRYEDTIDLTGEVRQADLDGLSFTLKLDAGDKISGKFTADQEHLVTDALREHSSQRVRVQGTAEFSPVDGAVKRIARIDQIKVVPVEDQRFDPSARPIWEVVAELGAQIPEAEWAKVPSDLAKNLEKYLHGDESKK